MITGGNEEESTIVTLVGNKNPLENIETGLIDELTDVSEASETEITNKKDDLLKKLPSFEIVECQL